MPVINCWMKKQGAEQPFGSSLTVSKLCILCASVFFAVKQGLRLLYSYIEGVQRSICSTQQVVAVINV